MEILIGASILLNLIVAVAMIAFALKGFRELNGEIRNTILTKNDNDKTKRRRE